MFALVVAGEIVFGLPFHTARFFRPTLLEVFGFTNTQLGDLFAVYGITAMISYFPGGALADRFPARSAPRLDKTLLRDPPCTIPKRSVQRAKVSVEEPPKMYAVNYEPLGRKACCSSAHPRRRRRRRCRRCRRHRRRRRRCRHCRYHPRYPHTPHLPVSTL